MKIRRTIYVFVFVVLIFSMGYGSSVLISSYNNQVIAFSYCVEAQRYADNNDKRKAEALFYMAAGRAPGWYTPYLGLSDLYASENLYDLALDSQKIALMLNNKGRTNLWGFDIEDEDIWIEKRLVELEKIIEEKEDKI